MKKHLTFAVVAAICASCSNEEFVPKVDEMTGTPVRVIVGVNNLSRAAHESGALTIGSLGLYFTTGDGTETKYNASNREVKYENDTWVVQGDPLLWKNSTTPVNYYAYHPYTADVSDENTITITATADQSAGIDNDFLYAKTVQTTGAATTEGGTPNAIPISFEHKMCKLTVTLAKGAELGDEASFAGVAINTYYGERSFDLSSGEWIEPESYYNGSGAEITMYKNESEAYEAIFIPQDQKFFHVIITLEDGRNFTYKNSALKFEPGSAYTLNLIVGRNIVSLSKVNVSDWTSDGNILGEDNFGNPDENLGYTLVGNTYTIYTEEGLRAVNEIFTAPTVWAGKMASNITLGADITLSKPEDEQDNWHCIGDMHHPYTGTFDGAGHSITGLITYYNHGAYGLIGELGKEGVIKNLTLIDCQVYAGAIAGVNNGGTINNCHVKSMSEGCLIQTANTSSAGAITGINNGVIFGCTVSNAEGGNITIKGHYEFGGIVGVNKGSIKDCHVEASNNEGSITIEGTDTYYSVSYVGGIVGCVGSEGEIKTKDFVISGCSVTAKNGSILTVTGVSKYVGGLVGASFKNAVISGCHAENINVVGTSGVGGLLGYAHAMNDGYTCLISCLAKGVNVTATGDAAKVGGILGECVSQSSVYGTKLIACYSYQCTKGESETFSSAENISPDNMLFSVENCYFATTNDESIVTPVNRTIGSGISYNVGASTSWDDANTGALNVMNDKINKTTLNITNVDKYEWGGTMTNPTLTKQ